MVWRHLSTCSAHGILNATRTDVRILDRMRYRSYQQHQVVKSSIRDLSGHSKQFCVLISPCLKCNLHSRTGILIMYHS